MKQNKKELRQEFENLMKMLNDEGECDGECRDKKIVEATLLFILLRLDEFKTLFLIIFGCIAGHLIGCVLDLIRLFL